MINVAINGFGRIGRMTFRHLMTMKNINVVAVNDLTDAHTLAHLLKYDSNIGVYSLKISSGKNFIKVGTDKFQMFAERDPANLPWKSLNVDVVIESTGRFRTQESAGKHIQAGARKVIISAPAKGDIPTIVIGVNDNLIKKKDRILSNASCTTNCLAPMAKILDEAYGIKQGFMTTIHAYTADQKLQDAPHEDLRRSRAAAENIIPTTTGAASAVGLVLPNLKGKLQGFAARVPVVAGSLTDLTVQLTKKVEIEDVNALFKKSANGKMKGIIEYTEDPIVSRDIVGNPHSCIFDAPLTMVNGNLVKVVGWYDNEYGYSARTAQLVGIIG